jgi:hypothetical protein
MFAGSVITAFRILFMSLNRFGGRQNCRCNTHDALKEKKYGQVMLQSAGVAVTCQFYNPRQSMPLSITWHGLAG